jgi:hypothetical protein
VTRRFKVSEITSAVLVTIGAGGTGAAAITADSTLGATGIIGGNSTFGSYVTAYGGAGGAGGNTVAVSGGGGGGASSAGNGSTGGSPLIVAAAGTTQQFGGGGGSDPSSAGKDSAYGGGGGGHCNTTSNSNAGTSVFSGGGGAGGAGITSANASIPCNAAGGTNATLSPSTSNQAAINGLAGAAFTGGQGGAGVVVNSNFNVQAVVYGDSKFLAVTSVGTESFFSTSLDGTTAWNVTAVPVSGFAASHVLHDGAKWVFYNSTQVYTSVDLISFNPATAPAGFTPQHIAFAGGMYVAVGTGGNIRTSIDLATWTPRVSGVATTLSSVIYNGVKWIIVGTSGVTLTSSDGITWTLVTISGTPVLFSIAANGSTLVAHTGTSPFAQYSTDTGATWNPVATVMGTASSTGNRTLNYVGGKFILLSGSTLYTSTDGNTWALQTDGTTDNYSTIAYDGTTYVVGSSTLNSNIGITSTDAVTWTSRTLVDGRTPVAGNGGNGGIVAGGGGGSASLNGYNSGAGGNGGNGFVRVYAW